MKEQLGKYCLDMSKLVFGGAILSAIVKENLPVFWIVLVGCFVVTILAISGFLLIKKIK
jgi:hypothetical protein